MRPTPVGWPRIASSLFYDEPRKAIDWVVDVFGFEIRLLVEGDDGAVHHSELTYGDGLIMIGGTDRASHRRSPRAFEGANTQSIMVYVDDVEAHCAHARGKGATITMEPKTSDYGEEYWTDRTYEAADLEGHRWWFVQRLSDPNRPPPDKKIERA